MIIKKNISSAKKDHECIYCLGKIKKGSQYIVEVFITDDGLSHQSSHQFCRDIFLEYNTLREDDYITCLHEEFVECLKEHMKYKGDSDPYDGYMR